MGWGFRPEHRALETNKAAQCILDPPQAQGAAGLSRRCNSFWASRSFCIHGSECLAGTGLLRVWNKLDGRAVLNSLPGSASPLRTLLWDTRMEN